MAELPERMSEHERIIKDPAILAGKPVVRGSRISVELVLQHLANNPDLDDLFAAFPELTREDVQACLAYARAIVARQRRRRLLDEGMVPGASGVSG